MTKMGTTEIQAFYVHVLGCKVNQYDARQIEELLGNYGLTYANNPETADIIVVHTCGVTSAAAQKSRQAIRRLRRNNSSAHIFITGCAADESLTGIENESFRRIPAGNEWLRNLAREVEKLSLPRSGFSNTIRTDETMISGFGKHTRAFLKIQDGCDIGCSYCIIPRLRKAPRDKPIEIAVSEAERLTRNGYREIVITGVSVGLYGRDTGTSLAEVLRRIVQIPNIGRIRLSSLHPSEITDELLEVWASSDHIMPHLHMSLQSGSDAILKAMRRNYTTEEFFDVVTRARQALDNPAFTTDVIVGFPGETEEDFQKTLKFCQKVGFSRIHTFGFSPRPGTPAARMPGQIDGNTITRRSKELRVLAAKLSLSYHREYTGKTVCVLVEKDRNGRCEGLSPHYIPVQFPSEDQVAGEIVPILVKNASVKGVSGVKNFQHCKLKV